MNCFQDTTDPAAARLAERRAERQALAERLLHRAELLDPADRALIESVYSDHVPLARLARVRGQTPAQVRRRRLGHRLLDPLTEFILAHREDWPADRWQAARAHLIAGQTLRQTASGLNLTLHAVRRHIEAVRTLLEEAQGQQRAGRAGGRSATPSRRRPARPAGARS
jgi:hypothetical protein